MEPTPHVAALIERGKGLPEQGTKEWLQRRSTMLTASDVATALNLNPNKTRLALLYDKCGVGTPFEGNAITEFGHKYEPIARDKYCLLENKTVFEFGCLTHPEYPFLGGSPDGITADGVLLEIKCPPKRDIIPGVVPAYYLPQVLLGMEIYDLDVCHFVQYKPDVSGFGREIYDLTVVPRDKAWFASVLPDLKTFINDWADLKAKVDDGWRPPPKRVVKRKEKDVPACRINVN